MQKIADILETDVGQLLGSEIHSEEQNNEVVEQLARINEQLVIKNRRARRIWKTIGIILLIGLLLNILLVSLFMIDPDSQGTSSEIVIEEKVEVEEP